MFAVRYKKWRLFKNVSLSTLMKIAGVLDCSAMIWC